MYAPQSIVALSLLLTLAGCQHKQPAAPVDGVSSATTPHESIIYPPSNSNYRVLGHLEGLNGYVVKYDDTLYRGGRVYIEDIGAEALHTQGIKTIISVVPDSEETAFCASNGFSLIEIPFIKPGPTPADYETFFHALETATPPFYVHCNGGSHRAGILGAAYRIKMQHWSFDQAMIEYGRLGGDLKGDHEMLETLRHIETVSK